MGGVLDFIALGGEDMPRCIYLIKDQIDNIATHIITILRRMVGSMFFIYSIILLGLD